MSKVPQNHKKILSLKLAIMKEKTLRFAKTIFQTINFKDVIHENPKSSVPHLISHNLIFSGILPR